MIVMNTGWNYANVLLFTDKPIPLLLPYIYDPLFRAETCDSARRLMSRQERREGGATQRKAEKTEGRSGGGKTEGRSGGNTLLHWNLINNSLLGVRHCVDALATTVLAPSDDDEDETLNPL